MHSPYRPISESVDQSLSIAARLGFGRMHEFDTRKSGVPKADAFRAAAPKYLWLQRHQWWGAGTDVDLHGTYHLYRWQVAKAGLECIHNAVRWNYSLSTIPVVIPT